MQTIRKYRSILRIRFANGMQYRAAALAGIVTQFAWGGMYLILYHTFYQSGTGAFPMDMQALSAYIWLQQAFLALFMIWGIDVYKRQPHRVVKQYFFPSGARPR